MGAVSQKLFFFVEHFTAICITREQKGRRGMEDDIAGAGLNPFHEFPDAVDEILAVLGRPLIYPLTFRCVGRVFNVRASRKSDMERWG